MEPLTVGNSRVKEARKLSRRSVRTERRLFLADGPKAVEGALAVPGAVVEVFVTPAASEQYAALRTAEVPWTLLEERALASLSDSVSPAGVVALCRFLDRPLGHVLDADRRLLAICADIRDPGNAGAVIRCADAAGADGVVFVGDSVDPYNPKSVRATVGSIFHLPIAIERDVEASLASLQAAGLTVLAADGQGDVGLFDDDLDLSVPVAWLMGNEAWGLPGDVRALADRVVAVPIFGRAESLNLATAAAVCLYATARVRHN